VRVDGLECNIAAYRRTERVEHLPILSGPGDVARRHVLDRLAASAQCAGENLGALARQSRADVQVEVGPFEQRVEIVIREAHAARCTHRVAMRFQQRAVLLQPQQGYQSERYLHPVIGRCNHRARECFGDARQYPQQRQLVARGLVVIDDDVAQQGEAAGTVVRQFVHHRLPVEIIARKVRLRNAQQLHERPLPCLGAELLC
jgi:hypothetical protein